VIIGFNEEEIDTDKKLELFINKFSGFPTKAQLVRNPGGKLRPLGVVEFANVVEAISCIENINQSNCVYAKPLYKMVYPDVIGGTCSL